MCCVELGAHIQAFTFSSQDHGRLNGEHISKHSLFRLKITVGCRLCTCPSVHFSLDEDTLKITVGWCVCVDTVVRICMCMCGEYVCVDMVVRM